MVTKMHFRDEQRVQSIGNVKIANREYCNPSLLIMVLRLLDGGLVNWDWCSLNVLLFAAGTGAKCTGKHSCGFSGYWPLCWSRLRLVVAHWKRVVVAHTLEAERTISSSQFAFMHVGYNNMCI
jgi:hypothetical protein